MTTRTLVPGLLRWGHINDDQGRRRVWLQRHRVDPRVLQGSLEKESDGGEERSMVLAPVLRLFWSCVVAARKCPETLARRGRPTRSGVSHAVGRLMIDRQDANHDESGGAFELFRNLFQSALPGTVGSGSSAVGTPGRRECIEHASRQSRIVTKYGAWYSRECSSGWRSA
jgi:hypothetical protein